jgi:predicted methyltransferase
MSRSSVDRQLGFVKRNLAGVLPIWLIFALLGSPVGILAQEAARADAQVAEEAKKEDDEGAKKKADEEAKKKADEEAKKKAAAEKARKRAKSVRALLGHLGVGEGSVIADIGAGGGQDTWTFADVVGPTGTVFAEEIAEEKVKSVKKEAEKRGLTQVRPVLGKPDDPSLEPNSADLAFVRYVYHHFSKPREMLRGIWRSLKPGGYFVVVDRKRGTLEDWVPRDRRAKKHFWLAETTVVREAREEGFTFVECAEEGWYEKEPFVLVFQRPEGHDSPGQDPDPFLTLPDEQASRLLLPDSGNYQRPVFVALGEARKLIPPILEKTNGQPLEIVLEEWATQKDERPPLPAGVCFPSVLTEKGDPKLGDEPVDAVFFLDAYHLLFHGKTLLAKIREKLAPGGRVFVLDREAKEPLSRRDASHRRRITVEMVKQEMIQAGFSIQCRAQSPAPDRFLLVFGLRNTPANNANQRE